MDISLINSQSLLRLLSLTERKEELLKLIDEIDAAIIGTLQGGISVEVIEMEPTPSITAPAPKRSAKKTKTGKPGGLKARILALLQEAGDQGLPVKEIAGKLGAKPANISTWFSTTGKAVTTKVAPGRYAIKEVRPVDASDKPAVSPAEAPKAKKKGGITPGGRAKLAASMKARWAARKADKPAKKGFKLPKVAKNPF